MIRKRITAVLVTVCMVLGGCGNTSEEEEATAFTVNGEAVSLREWNFYVRMNQMQWEKEGLETWGDDMWSQAAGEEEGTTRADRLKEEVQETICRIHLACQYAKEYGVSLDEAKQREVRERAGSFMDAYHEALLDYAGADEAFVYEKLSERELSLLVEEEAVADYEPVILEEEVHREGICYVLISTTGLRDSEGNLLPFTEEEVKERTKLAEEVCRAARESGKLKETAEANGLTPIEASMGRSNEGDGHEPRMLDAARELAVGEISDPVWTEEGWFLVQHMNDYDEVGTDYWREKLTKQAKTAEYERIYEEWKAAAEIVTYPEVMDQVEVKIVLKELL